VVGATPAAGVPMGGPAWSHAPACRAYHELVVAQLTGGRATFGPELAGHRHAPLAAGAVPAAGPAADAMGNRRHDPGLAARVVAGLPGPGTPRAAPTVGG